MLISLTRSTSQDIYIKDRRLSFFFFFWFLTFTSLLLELICWILWQLMLLDLCSLLRLRAVWIACSKTERWQILKISAISQQVNYRIFSSSAISKHVSSRGGTEPKLACMLTNTVAKNWNDLSSNCRMEMRVYHWNRSNCFFWLVPWSCRNLYPVNLMASSWLQVVEVQLGILHTMPLK